MSIPNPFSYDFQLREYATTTEGQTIQTYRGWIWQCPDCYFAFRVSGDVNDDGKHSVFQCPVCLGRNNRIAIRR